MREKLIMYLKLHTSVLRVFWAMARWMLSALGLLLPVRKKTMLFCCLGGRMFGDSPKAIYDEVQKRQFFDDWELIWAFVEPERYEIPRGRKVKIDTVQFYITLLTSNVWVSNSGMDRGIGIHTKKSIIKVETWHGCPLKKICGEENTMPFGGGRRSSRHIDSDTIRCAQSEYDLEIYARVFDAAPEAFLLCDLPRNDILLDYTKENLFEIRQKLNIPAGKKVILYMPTYREYLLNEYGETYIKPPIDIDKWKEQLGDEYVLLIRTHYAVMEALKIENDGFVRDMSQYTHLSELYAVADILISDYSSAFVDYSIVGGVMFCFAYDLDEYVEKRGLYVDLEETLPCPVDRDEDTLIKHILNMDKELCASRTEQFRQKFAPHAGHASQCVVNEVETKLKEQKR